jgi:hypothetical protein
MLDRTRPTASILLRQARFWHLAWWQMMSMLALAEVGDSRGRPTDHTRGAALLTARQKMLHFVHAREVEVFTARVW